MFQSISLQYTVIIRTVKTVNLWNVYFGLHEFMCYVRMDSDINVKLNFILSQHMLHEAKHKQILVDVWVELASCLTIDLKYGF